MQHLRAEERQLARLAVGNFVERNGVVEAFLAQALERVKVMDDAASLDWRALRMGSPALPGFMPKMNLGDVFRVHVVHVNRHAKQIERVVGKL